MTIIVQVGDEDIVSAPPPVETEYDVSLLITMGYGLEGNSEALILDGFAPG